MSKQFAAFRKCKRGRFQIGDKDGKRKRKKSDGTPNRISHMQAFWESKVRGERSAGNVGAIRGV